jgi:ABC-type sulfate/molybdate transport systems ATPase subunit
MEETYSAHGHVTITDCQTGETLVDKDNMIVATGRELIMNAVFGQTTSQVLTQSNFRIFVEANDTKATTAEMTCANLNIVGISTTGDTIGVALNPNSSDTEPNTAQLTYTYKIEAGKANQYVTAVGIIYQTDGTAGTNILFSRVMFDPIYMRATRTYKITYKVKF